MGHLICSNQRRGAAPGAPSRSRQTTGVAALVGVAALLAACGGGQSQQLSATKLGDVSFPLPLASADAPLHCGDGAPTEAGSQLLDRLPYLQRTSESNSTVLFTTLRAEAEPPTLELKSPGGQLLRAIAAVRDPAVSDGRQWSVTLSELEPGTSHCYSIAGWTHPTELRTAPAAGEEKPVRFVVLGDSGSGSDGQLAVRDQLSLVPFDLMLHTGDVAYESGTLEALESTFFDVYGDYLRQVPAFPIMGNHDYRTAAGEPFRQVFALPENGGDAGHERWYSFDFGDVHFVGLDTERDLAAQAEWLERDLSANQLPWTIVYLHRPPFSSGEHGSDLTVRRAFAPLFERHGVQLVFAGHDHDYERTVPVNGVTYVVTGGGGRGTRPVGTSAFTAFSESTLHFVAGSVAGSTLELHAIDATGQPFDSLRLSL